MRPQKDCLIGIKYLKKGGGIYAPISDFVKKREGFSSDLKLTRTQITMRTA